jgi:phage terminase small subunit
MGRPRKSEAEKKLTGTNRKDRAPKRGGKPSGEVKCPVWLSKDAKKEWKRLVPPLVAAGVLHVGHVGSLTRYCEAVAHYERETRWLNRNESKYGEQEWQERFNRRMKSAQEMQRASKLLQLDQITVNIPSPRPAASSGDEDEQSVLDRRLRAV